MSETASRAFDATLRYYVPGARFRGVTARLPLALLGVLWLAFILSGKLGLKFVGLYFILPSIWAIRKRTRRETSGRVRADVSGVELDDRRLPRADIAHGFFDADASGASGFVRLVDRNGETIFEAQMESAAQAASFLRALDVAPYERRVEFSRLAPIAQQAPSRLGSIGVMLFGARLVPNEYAWLIAYALALLAIFVVFSLVPGRVTIGADGVELRWLGRSRFIPLADVVAIEPSGGAGVIIRTTGRAPTVVTTDSADADEAARDRDAIVARLRSLLAKRDARRAAPPDLARLLGRAGRTRAAWTEELAKFRDEGYRTFALRDDDLWAMVEDSFAAEDVRAGAAFVLRAGDDARDRLRVAAEQTASPRLRLALDAASQDGEADVLAAWDDQATRKARSHDDA